MVLVDFEELNHRCEKAILMTRNARNLDRRDARRVGEAAARVLRQVVSDMRQSRLRDGPRQPPAFRR